MPANTRVVSMHEILPFIKHSDLGDYKMSASRIFEAIIIAFITGALSVYATQKVLETKIDGITQQMNRIEQSVEKMRDDFYRPSVYKDNRP